MKFAACYRTGKQISPSSPISARCGRCESVVSFLWVHSYVPLMLQASLCSQCNYCVKRDPVCCTPMFMAVLFVVAKRWKQSTCPLTVEWTDVCVSKTSNGILFSVKKERSPVTCCDRDESGGHYVKWNKLLSKAWILWFHFREAPGVIRFIDRSWMALPGTAGRRH